MTKKITVSIISHNHGSLVTNCLSKLIEFPEIEQIILTLNTKNDLFFFKKYKNSKVRKIFNKYPLGFANNHNNAFKLCNTNFFCILNPDIDFLINPFSKILNKFKKTNVALVAPCLYKNNENIQISVRKFPSPLNLFGKYVFFNEKYNLQPNDSCNWISGAFLIIPRNIYSMLNGFDENFYLYCEDIDLCLRIKKFGFQIIFDDEIKVLHFGQKDSHKKISFFLMHLKSLLLIYFYKYCLRKY